MLELQVQNICDAYCEDGHKPDAFMWISSFVILVGAATFDWPSGTTMQSIMENSSQQQREALHCADVNESQPLTMCDRAEWLMRAGEIRLMLHEGWAGNWDALNIMDACRAYREALGENRAITLMQRRI